MCPSGIEMSSAREDQTVVNIRCTVQVSKRDAPEDTFACPFRCPLGPALGPLITADSGIDAGQERQIVRPALVYAVSCRDSVIP